MDHEEVTSSGQMAQMASPGFTTEYSHPEFGYTHPRSDFGPKCHLLDRNLFRNSVLKVPDLTTIFPDHGPGYLCLDCGLRCPRPDRDSTGILD